jgi:hypothetical protein
VDEKKALKPSKTTYQRTPKPSSGSTNLMIRRKGLAIMINAIRRSEMSPWVAAFAGAAVAGAAVYIILNIYHPGLVGTPPPGYYYKVLPIPQNATVVH